MEMNAGERRLTSKNEQNCCLRPTFIFQVCDSPDHDSQQYSPEGGVSADHRILKRVMPSNVEPTYKETDAV